MHKRYHPSLTYRTCRTATYCYQYRVRTLLLKVRTLFVRVEHQRDVVTVQQLVRRHSVRLVRHEPRHQRAPVKRQQQVMTSNFAAAIF